MLRVLLMTTLESKIERRARWDDRVRELYSYVRPIRNREKRAYAVHYLGFRLGMTTEPEPSTYGASFMALQAVRLHIGNYCDRWTAEVRRLEHPAHPGNRRSSND